MEDRIVQLRKELSDQGLDAGAHTIAFHLAQGQAPVPSVPTIWRVLTRRGFVTPQPHKRPKSSCVRPRSSPGLGCEPWGRDHA
jgi:hypothetical protein